ncbi:hypothetical protein ACFY3U_15600 [Micromonospora sp. NPDC000089]|uniref:hypothetical protein n=1 Tax=unclassified Micromonospora TaxID=2617518 RepID=UPI00368A6BF9
MRLTVGPLPSAVYWRRRAVVLGAGLLFLIVLLYSCNQPGGTTTTPGAQSTPSSPAAQPTATAPGAADPPTGTATPGGSTAPATGAGTTPTADPTTVPPVDAPSAPPATDDGTCTDAEIAVTPVATPSRVQRGAPVDLGLKIRNTSQRTCSRDVGADLQELFVKSGAERVWSSDTCGTGKGHDVQSFTPGFERSYQLTWNGMDTSRCSLGVAAGPNPAAGTYQVFARVGSKLSDPVSLVITG